MGQIIFSRNPTGRLGGGAFLMGIGVFLYSAMDPVFGPVAAACIGAGAAVAMVLALRDPGRPHIDPRAAETEDAPRPIQPR